MVFWDNIVHSGLLNDPSLILAGDLNLTLSSTKIWGSINVVDPLANYFRENFENAKLFDVVPSVMVPTWSNGRIGNASIAKRIDRFLMSEGLHDIMGRFRSWAIPTWV